MLGRERDLKAQNAMEYLTTYGWAILVIALVMLALWKAGILGGLLGTATSCNLIQGYICNQVVLGTNGNVSFVFAQNGGSTIYNVGMACTSSINTVGTLPNPTTAMVYLSSTGATTALSANGPAAGGLSLPPGQSVTVSGLKCFDSNANPLVAQTLGVAYYGYVWLNFTTGSAAPGGSNPMITAQLGKLNAQVV